MATSNTENKPNQGVLFTNKYKKEENHPDLKGDIFLDKELVQLLLNESKDSVIKIQLGCYKKESKGIKYLAVYASKPYEKQITQSVPNVDDDIPF
jgi:hypothetical protein